MPNRTPDRLMLYGVGLAFVVVVAHLGWEYSHGGVQSHHLLRRQDLPAISNWWGILALPAVGCLASYFVTLRLASGKDTLGRALAAFAGALLLGASLAASFAMGHRAPTYGLFIVTLAAGLFLRTYRAEYAFGYVLGMTFAFGSVLPTIIAAVAATISAFVHLMIRPLLGMVMRRVRA